MATEPLPLLLVGPKKADKIRSGYLTLAFLGPDNVRCVPLSVLCSIAIRKTIDCGIKANHLIYSACARVFPSDIPV